jgi:hypothetical protein
MFRSTSTGISALAEDDGVDDRITLAEGIFRRPVRDPQEWRNLASDLADRLRKHYYLAWEE